MTARHCGGTHKAAIKNRLRALACQVDEVNVVMSASQSHNMANLRMTPEQSLDQFAEIAKLVDSKAFLNASLSTAFGCPFEGQVPLSRVLEMIDRFSDIGIEGVTLCDTTGVGNPRQVMEVCQAVQDRWPALVFTAHFHNTRGMMGLANALVALQAGPSTRRYSLPGGQGTPVSK